MGTDNQAIANHVDSTALITFPKPKYMKLIRQQMMHCEICWHSRKIEQMKPMVRRSILH